MSSRLRPKCVDCGKAAPSTETNFALISARHGWRLLVQKSRDGRRSTIWRCPDCWTRFNSGG